MLDLLEDVVGIIAGTEKITEKIISYVVGKTKDWTGAEIQEFIKLLKYINL